jgi:hypothetical protein
LNQGYQSVEPALLPQAIESGSAASEAATRAATAAAKGNQDSMDYIGNALVPLLVNNPDGVTSEQARAAVGVLNRRGVGLPLPAAALVKEFTGMTDPVAIRNRLREVEQRWDSCEPSSMSRTSRTRMRSGRRATHAARAFSPTRRLCSPPGLL